MGYTKIQPKEPKRAASQPSSGVTASAKLPENKKILELKRVVIKIISGGNKDIYAHRVTGATFRRSPEDRTIFFANVPAEKAGYYNLGRTFELKCGCGGGLATHGQVTEVI